MNILCPLCGASEPAVIAKPPGFFQCAACALIYRDPSQLLKPEEELERYRLHNNSDTADYRRHLSQLTIPLTARLKPGAEGLDYGCGPVPVLSSLFNQAGYPTKHFDPFFFNDRNVLNHQYDFITCCEVVEHFYHPAKEFALLRKMLKPGGWLAVMTQPPPPLEEFANWYYHRDPTHVVFYGAETLSWIAKQWKLRHFEYPKGVTLFQK